MSASGNHDPLRPHRHDPNPEPPAGGLDFVLIDLTGHPRAISPADLLRLPRTVIPRYAIVSTGHGTSGPFSFGGVTVRDLLQTLELLPAVPFQLEVLSADGFGNRIDGWEVLEGTPAGPLLLSDELDGQPMSREQGAVRLIVPSETDDALRQVKWIATIRVLALD